MVMKYCQKCGQSRLVPEDLYVLKPCGLCGASEWALLPKKHATYCYALTDDDRTFLRVQGIDPEGN